MSRLVFQYAYLELVSSTLSSNAITAAVGLAPDTVSGPDPSGRSGWAVEDRRPGITIGEQVAAIVDRLAPSEERLATLVRDPARDVQATLRIVRYLDDPEGQPEHLTLGWFLTPRVLEFLVHVGADVEADEIAT